MHEALASIVSTAKYIRKPGSFYFSKGRSLETEFDGSAGYTVSSYLTNKGNHRGSHVLSIAHKHISTDHSGEHVLEQL